MWAHAFRDNKYYAAVDTNNGTESLNKALKYSYLPRRKSLTEDIKVLEHERFEVFKTDGGKHVINFNVPECTCKD